MTTFETIIQLLKIIGAVIGLWLLNEIRKNTK